MKKRQSLYGILMLGAGLLGLGIYLAASPTRTNASARQELEDLTASSPASSIEVVGSLKRARQDAIEQVPPEITHADLNLRIQTIDEFNQAVPLAKVFAIENTGRTLLGTTDERGELALPLPSETVLEIMAIRDGYAYARVSAPENATGSDATGSDATGSDATGRTSTPWVVGLVELTLRTAATSLRGQVFYPNDVPVEAGCIVIAVPEGDLSASSRAIAARAGRGIPSPQSTLTDDQGRFEFSHLRADRKWDIYGRIGAFASPYPAKVVAAEPCRVDLLKVYAMRMSVQDTQGNPPAISPLVYGERRRSSLSLYTKLTYHDMSPKMGIAPMLFGLDSRTTWKNKRWESVHMYAVDGEPETFGTIKGVIQVPGYTSKRYELELDPLLGDQIPLTVIPIEADTADWGSLTIDFSGPLPRDGKDLHTGRFSPVVIIMKHIATDEIFTAAVRRFDEPLILEAIPCGEYIIKAKLPQAWAEFEASDMRISVSQQVSKCVIDLSMYGFIDIRYFAAGNEEFDGTAWIKVTDKATGWHIRSMRYDQAPYSMLVPAPGEYRAQMTFSQGSKDGPTGTVSVHPHELSEVIVQ